VLGATFGAVLERIVNGANVERGLIGYGKSPPGLRSVEVHSANGVRPGERRLT